MIEIGSTHRSFVRPSLSLSLSLAPRDGPLARASTLDAFDDTVRPRASSASAADGARESDVDGSQNCAQLVPRDDNRRVMTHEKGTVLAPYPEKIFFNNRARASPSVVCCRLPVYLSASSATMCAAL